MGSTQPLWLPKHVEDSLRLGVAERGWKDRSIALLTPIRSHSDSSAKSRYIQLLRARLRTRQNGVGDTDGTNLQFIIYIQRILGQARLYLFQKEIPCFYLFKITVLWIRILFVAYPSQSNPGPETKIRFQQYQFHTTMRIWISKCFENPDPDYVLKGRTCNNTVCNEFDEQTKKINERTYLHASRLDNLENIIISISIRNGKQNTLSLSNILYNYKRRQ